MIDSGKSMRIMSLQPFYGGSHRQFIDQWIKRSRHRWSQETLPDRHWKWRMRHSAIEFAQRVDRLWDDGQRFDLIFATDMLNVAEFRGLLRSDAVGVPVLLYLHENQFAYPNNANNVQQPRDFHFAFTNLTSAIAADFVWFNSRFNRDSMLEQLRSMMKIWPDYQPKKSVDLIGEKAEVQYPGICERVSAGNSQPGGSGGFHLVWASRWEYDKNPALLLEILHRLTEREFEFRLSVLGQQYKNSPVEFEQIHQQFGHRIENWGYLESRKDYLAVLRNAELFLSTADHEFFGIAAAEAVAAGCLPMFPSRLAYPELLSIESFVNREKFLYSDSKDAADKIIQLAQLEDTKLVGHQLSQDFFLRFGWKNRAAVMDSRIETLVGKADNAAERNR